MSDTEEQIPDQIASEPSNTPLMWMHIAWLPTIMPIVPLLIWGFICQRKPQAWKHMKNILNASFTFILFHTVSLFSFIGLMIAFISHGFIEGTVWWSTFEEHGHTGVSFHTPNPIPGILYLAIYMSVLVCAIISIVFVSAAARRGKILPYWWAIRFFKVE
jgi:vacuolar-type H+-ATPase subunit I/STV1